jgi:flagellar motor switch protein FliM
MSQNFLSQQEVDALLRGVSSGIDDHYSYYASGSFNIRGETWHEVNIYNDEIVSWLTEHMADEISPIVGTHSMSYRQMLSDKAFATLILKYPKNNS